MGPRPRNFIVFFDEKVGSTALISLLDRMRDICIVQLATTIAYEPFDRHNCGPMPKSRLKRCLNMTLGGGAVDMRRLNRLYLKTGRGALQPIDASYAVGFKMRFRPPWPAVADRLPKLRWGPVRRGMRLLRERLRRHQRESFARMIFDVVRSNHVVAFVMIRNDLLRWALSHYHGDGTGQPGHLQFRLAAGEISRHDIGRLHVDCDRLAGIIDRCRADHDAKLRLHADLLAAGIDAHLICYEDFLHRREQCVRQVLKRIGIDPRPDELSEIARGELPFQKVHPDRIDAFVENHEEVTARFRQLLEAPTSAGVARNDVEEAVSVQPGVAAATEVFDQRRHDIE